MHLLFSLIFCFPANSFLAKRGLWFCPPKSSDEIRSRVESYRFLCGESVWRKWRHTARSWPNAWGCFFHFLFLVNNSDFDIILSSKCRQKQERLLKNCSSRNQQQFLRIVRLCWLLDSPSLVEQSRSRTGKRTHRLANSSRSLKPGYHPHTPTIINPHPSFARTCKSRIASNFDSCLFPFLQRQLDRLMDFIDINNDGEIEFR